MEQITAARTRRPRLLDPDVQSRGEPAAGGCSVSVPIPWPSRQSRYSAVKQEWLQVSFIESTRAWASKVKRDGMTLWYAASHPATPWYAKALGLFVVAYALSPIDLIPDFIPVLGYLDDVILLPALICLTIRLLPPAVVLECRAKAEKWLAEGKAKPKSATGAVIIVVIWIAAITALGWWFLKDGNLWLTG